MSVDFDSALLSLNFNGEADDNGAAGGNGIPDGAEMALLQFILDNNEIDLVRTGGVNHIMVRQAYKDSLLALQTDLGALLIAWPQADQAIAGFVLLGETSFATINRMSSSFGAPLEGDYSTALALDKYLSAEGDADGDGFSNREEYIATGNDGLEAYLIAALNPEIKPSASRVQQHQTPSQAVVTIGIVLYPGFEVLDVYGPIEMWSYGPNMRIVLIAEQAGPVMSAQGTSTIATHSFASAPELDVLMVPGGNGTRGELHNSALLDFIVQANQLTRYTASVCTGSALLAASGILDGHRATTNKRAFYLAEQQSDRVDWIDDARWVHSGKMWTSSGVSAGTDMALALIAEINGIEAAREIARSLEYRWHEDAASDPFSEFTNRLTQSTTTNGALVKSEPAANSVLTSSPRYLRLYFSNTPDIADSTVRLLSIIDGKDIDIGLSGMHTMGNSDVMLSINTHLEPGQYRVSWNVKFQGATGSSRASYEFRVASKP